MSRVPLSPRRRRIRCLAVSLIAVLAAAGALLARPSEPAAATASDEAAFVSAINAVRAGAGLAPFTVNAELAGLARDHARVMADAGEIFHASPISAGYTGPWAKMGENVGVGASVDVLVDAFVASSGHYANIVDPAFTQIGVGVVWQDSALYTTHRFLQLPGETATTTTTAAPTTTVAPPTTAPPAPLPAPTTAPPAPLPAPTTTVPTPPLPPPATTAERVMILLELLDRVGT